MKKLKFIKEGKSSVHVIREILPFSRLERSAMDKIKGGACDPEINGFRPCKDQIAGLSNSCQWYLIECRTFATCNKFSWLPN